MLIMTMFTEYTYLPRMDIEAKNFKIVFKIFNGPIQYSKYEIT